MKKLLALLLSLVMVFAMVACDAKPAEPTDPDPTESETSEGTSADPTQTETEDMSPYIELPEEFRTWDENGMPKDITRLGTAENGMTVSLRYEASKVGTEIMEKGGNAIDAAVATAFAQFVCLPEMCGIGGGGLLTFYSAETGETACLTFREVAPMFQTSDLWVEDNEGNIIGDHKRFGGLASGVPGEVAGLCYALDKWGTMSLADVIQPAIDMARQGYVATPALISNIMNIYDVMIKSEELTEIYLNEDGLSLKPGELIRNEYMARALEMIRDQGSDAVYKGAIAEQMVKVTQSAGGVMTMEDLSNYKPWEGEPVKGSYRGYTVYSSPSPSSGGTFLAEMLNIMECLPVQEFNSVELWHQLAEVQKMVWVDRAVYSGDTRFVDVPTKGLTDKDYAKSLAAKVDMTKAQSFTQGNPWEYDDREHPETTTLSVVDKDGNMVSITHTLNLGFGNQVYVDGYGFFMNNQLDDFVEGSGYANSLEPGKAPLSSMSPSVVIDPDGKPFMAISAPGGIQIYPGVAQVIMFAIDYGFGIDEAINSPRVADYGFAFFYSLELEGSPVLGELEKLGHANFTVGWGTIAVPVGIMIMPDGTLEGSTESNYGVENFSDGAAIGY